MPPPSAASRGQRGQLPAENRPAPPRGESGCAVNFFMSVYGLGIDGTFGTFLCLALTGLAMVRGMTWVGLWGLAAAGLTMAAAWWLARGGSRWLFLTVAGGIIHVMALAMIGPPWLIAVSAALCVWVVLTCRRGRLRAEARMMGSGTRPGREESMAFLLFLSPEVIELAGCPLCALEGVEGHGHVGQ